MKILLVVDGSSYSHFAIRTLNALKLPAHTSVIVLVVVPEHTFLGGLTFSKIDENLNNTRTLPFQKVKHLLGTAESGIKDLGQRHRYYLIKKIRKDS